MARPIRIEVAGGWYHVTARGNERRRIFADDKDRLRFVELLAEWVERFGLRLHAYVLMDNHYHLLVATPQTNLSQAMQWLGVSYTIWFNRRHRRVGHLFQGRFKAIVLEAETAAVEVSRYLHLNPVRVGQLGLGKTAQRRSELGMVRQPEARLVAERLERLRRYPWSSYRSYVGRSKEPSWLLTRPVLEMMGGHGLAEQQRAYQRWVEEAVREGLAESPWERLEAGVVLGGQRFVEQMRRHLRGDEREQPQLRRLQARPDWEVAVAAVERVKGERWEEFRDRYGDWGRDLALYLGRRHCGMKLRELAEKAGGIDYVSVAGAVRRFGGRVGREKKLAAAVECATKALNNR
ncbi:MAG TPA: transposase [Verrucomicrobiae bacterium]|nr:transposase [Verrucomicrobiae bacterium]